MLKHVGDKTNSDIIKRNKEYPYYKPSNKKYQCSKYYCMGCGVCHNKCRKKSFHAPKICHVITDCIELDCKPCKKYYKYKGCGKCKSCNEKDMYRCIKFKQKKPRKRRKEKSRGFKKCPCCKGR